VSSEYLISIDPNVLLYIRYSCFQNIQTILKSVKETATRVDIYHYVTGYWLSLGTVEWHMIIK
jgi:hypothetical protein